MGQDDAKKETTRQKSEQDCAAGAIVCQNSMTAKPKKRKSQQKASSIVSLTSISTDNVSAAGSSVPEFDLPKIETLPVGPDSDSDKHQEKVP
ncbi:hypothetical protein K435DRAFT_869084 [Dendrothele bispora CBS 962.96]|uniref:Uncharacterized protein n=1 Tax=Dendrothele bispora (strain CBS 962.96) TaxID=1314807 RepID=A0A4V4HD31_DENBC|nr:hypothetical protein K435DRAFT_869084 [Dendrothele bispora CBS 962.96]